MHTEIRPADPHDAIELARLEAEARAALINARGGEQLLAERPIVGERWAELLGAGGHHHVLVAAIDGVPVGYLQLGRRTVGHSEVATIEQVYVTPEAREVGFGDEMVAEAMRLARAAGAIAIEAEALPGDRETKNLYERAGITARKLIVYRGL